MDRTHPFPYFFFPSIWKTSRQLVAPSCALEQLNTYKSRSEQSGNKTIKNVCCTLSQQSFTFKLPRSAQDQDIPHWCSPYSVRLHLFPIPSLELNFFLNRSQMPSLVSAALRSTRQLLLSNDFKQFLKYSLKGKKGFCLVISRCCLPTRLNGGEALHRRKNPSYC